jgi:hypothetical protein
MSLQQTFHLVYKLDRPLGGITGSLWSKFCRRIYRLNRPHGCSRRSLWSNIFRRVYRLDKPRGGNKRNLLSKFFVAYIDWRGHVEAVAEVSGDIYSSHILA